MLENLSDREKEIFMLVCRNKTNLEIAEVIDMSEHTVKKDLRSVYKKLNIESHDPTDNQATRRRAMLFAQENGIAVGEELPEQPAYTLEDIERAAKILFPDQRIKVVKELVNFLQYRG